MKIVLIGQIASGKGTLSQHLQDELNFEPISIGLLLRKECESDSPEAQMIRARLERGELVPDDVALAVLKKHLDTIGDKNIIFDGYPRNIAQARCLDTITTIDKVLFLNVDESVIRDRFLGRRECSKCGYISNINWPDYSPICPRCGGEMAKRNDNNEEAMNSKMMSFTRDTLPVLDYYKERGLVEEIDAGQDEQYTLNEAKKILK